MNLLESMKIHNFLHSWC